MPSLARHSIAGAGLAFVLAVSGPPAGSAWAAPETFNTALPVARGSFVFREQLLYRRASDNPSAADRDLQVLGAISVLGYGATADLALFGAVPVLDKRLKVTLADGRRVERETSGLGDLRLFGRYTAFRDNAPGRTFRIAPFAGLELPTGENDARDAAGALPRTLQLGSGSWNPFVGMVLTYQTLGFQIDAQVQYQINTESDGFEFGDVARLDGSLQYRLWPQELSAGVPGFLYGVLEANLIHQRRNEVGGTEDPDSGGTSLFLAPGLQYVTKRWIVEGIVQLPLSQDLNGAALKDDFSVRAGFRLNF